MLTQTEQIKHVFFICTSRDKTHYLQIEIVQNKLQDFYCKNRIKKKVCAEIRSWRMSHQWNYNYLCFIYWYIWYCYQYWMENLFYFNFFKSSYLPDLVMTISVPFLWNCSHSSLCSNVTFGSSFTLSSSGGGGGPGGPSGPPRGWNPGNGIPAANRGGNRPW